MNDALQVIEALLRFVDRPAIRRHYRQMGEGPALDLALRLANELTAPELAISTTPVNAKPIDGAH